MRTPAQLSLLAPPYRNQQLFSDYYLDGVLPGRADWQALVERAAPVLEVVAAIYARYEPSANEAQTTTRNT
jgi:hypothetical protein